ncbi:GumC family protein [Clostridium sp. Cult2]|uniref:GumC family protein n=1 Tax=Clostridium sp. Cult2 TaxID=2079003 RepID=UPI001F0075CB|nr:Wzz/FepE/Etk N-terminal domain-containing protein [Clostridium sp. Cult2]MCF6464776.1 hypothetical protein [Clostridium sp. Cult2]
MEEISLRELIEILIKRKKFIILITLFAVITAGILSFFVISPQYEAKMVLMTSNISEQFQNIEGDSNGNVGKVLDAISRYPSMNQETYRQQIKTPAVMSKTIEDLNLQDEYSIESLASKINLEAIKDTELITIKMQHTDPEKAANIINKVGENFISVVESNAKDRASKTSHNIKEQMEVEKKKYDEALIELKELLSQPRNADELKLELNAKLKQITNFKTQLNELSIRKDALESAIQVAEKEPSQGGNVTIRQTSGMNLIIDDSAKTLKIELAEVKGSIESIEGKISEMQKDIETLQTELQDKQHEKSLIEQKVNIAQTTYEAFVKKYEELKVTESSKIGESSITVISRAFPSTRPVAPRKSLNVAISLVLGLMIGVFVAFFQEYWQSTEEEVESGKENI